MSTNSRGTSLGGILGALCIICIYFASSMPTSRIFLYGLSSIFCGIMVVETDRKWAWVFYGATSILSIFIIPNKAGLVPYILLLGYYGIMKYYIEKIQSVIFEILLKGLMFTASMWACYIFIKVVLGLNISIKFPLWEFGILALAIFYLYDFIYTKFMIYYETKFKKSR
jgi:hypothetical protein